MKMEASMLSIFVLLLSMEQVYAQAQNDIFENCGRNSVLDHLNFESIAPGSEATKAGDFPWVVSYGYFDDTKKWHHKCGGSIITPKLVLTAYHCFRDLNYQNNNPKFEIMAGEVDFINQPDDNNKVQVKKVLCGFKHPSKAPTAQSLYYDIAILYLEKSFIFTKYVRPMCMAKMDTSSYHGRLSRIIGWGSGASSLHEASVQIFSDTFCNTTYQNSRNFDRTAAGKAERALPTLFDSTVLCAGDDRSKAGACQGDSGGPLLVFEEADGINSHYEQVGIISGQIRCTKFPDIYTNLADISVKNFVTSIVAATQKDDALSSRDGLCIIPGSIMVQRYSDGLYTGKIVNDKREGNGTMVYDDGNVYNGEWKNDEPSGFGTKKNGTYNSYEGNFLHGFAEGTGTYYDQDGETYTGSWKQDLRHGLGKATFPDGHSYIGQFFNNFIHGKGTMYYPDGTVYIGEWQNGKKYGFGKENFTYGYYEGPFVNGEANGKGTFFYNDGTVYQGEFKDSVKHGMGKENFTDGYFEGQYLNGKREGLGTFYSNDGNIFSGQWEDDKPVSMS